MIPKVKICGMRDGDNILAVAGLGPDYMGFIFYGKSPRYAGNTAPCGLDGIPKEIERVGVFVNETAEEIGRRIRDYGLSMIQLHGEESPELCQEVRRNRPVVKAVSVRAEEDIRRAVEKYEEAVDYFLFDTKTPLYGGSGEQFDWTVLKAYDGGKPFFLSGGIGWEDAERILSLDMPKLTAVDINSRFETEPGRKDVERLKEFFRLLKRNY